MTENLQPEPDLVASETSRWQPEIEYALNFRLLHLLSRSPSKLLSRDKIPVVVTGTHVKRPQLYDCVGLSRQASGQTS
jgi:hypothetical protein